MVLSCDLPNIVLSCDHYSTSQLQAHPPNRPLATSSTSYQCSKDTAVLLLQETEFLKRQKKRITLDHGKQCIHTCTHTHPFTHAFTHVRTHPCMHHACTHIHTHTCTHAHLPTHPHTHTHAHTRPHISTLAHTRTHPHTHTHAHTCPHISTLTHTCTHSPTHKHTAHTHSQPPYPDFSNVFQCSLRQREHEHRGVVPQKGQVTSPDPTVMQSLQPFLYLRRSKTCK